MSRHRNVRKLNYDDERYEDEDYEYGHSYEDRYCVSPSTAAQFTFNREQNVALSSYMSEEDIPEEDNMEIEESKASMLEVDQARLSSCLDQLHGILGDSFAEPELIETVTRHSFNIETALDELLQRKEAPKPQRTERKRRNHTKGVSSATKEGFDNSSSSQSSSSRVGFDNSLPEVKPITASPNGPTVVTAAACKQIKQGFEENTNNSFVDRTNIEKISTSLIESVGVTEQLAGLKVETVEEKVKNPAVITLSNSIKDTDSPPSSRPSTPFRPGLPKSGSKSKTDKIDAKAEYAKRQGDKELINMVVIGHVDAGKSTLMGHLLYQLGSVHQRTMHKYEQESRKIGKSSFAFAWVLDETEEERSRGVTMDVAQTRFVTDKKVVTLLDAPGHKDFIPNMITGAAQADVAVLVINATRGEFETGFDSGGQTREHALLARSLGVSQIIVAVNKMDTVDWDKDRYDGIVTILRQFLKQVGFKDADVSFIPCSGLAGENLKQPAQNPRLTSWYSGPTLVQQIDFFKNPERPVDKPFRLSVSDVFKANTGGFSIAGRVSAGYLRPGDKVMVMPSGNMAAVKVLLVDDVPSQIVFAGDNVTIMLTGIDFNHINIGSVLCDPMFPTHCATRIRAKIVIFNLDVPITRGYPVVFHYQSINEPAIIKRLIAQINRSTGEVIKMKPKCVTKNSSAVVEIEFERSTCVELYSEYRDLGRFMLRQAGHTIAAGLVEEILQSKATKDD